MMIQKMNLFHQRVILVTQKVTVMMKLLSILLFHLILYSCTAFSIYVSLQM